MITTKQRAYLRKLGQTTDALYQIGKNGIIETTIETLDAALTARELIKITVLETSPVSPKEVMAELMEKLNCEAVQVIGRKVTVYRPNPEKPQITLPR
ncbi:MAG: YhbY family RNA-binding protein [Clostridia bacterium]|nr:YhbY family RNA-binding protein [Clostridia bacterium]